MSVVFRANMTGKAKLLQHCISYRCWEKGIMQKSAIEDDISDEGFDDRCRETSSVKWSRTS